MLLVLVMMLVLEVMLVMQGMMVLVMLVLLILLHIWKLSDNALPAPPLLPSTLRKVRTDKKGRDKY